MNKPSLAVVKRPVKVFVRAVTLPWATGRRLARDLRELGVRPGGCLMVHSSLSALGFVPTGARAVIHALQNVLGPEGTLVMPAHSWTLPSMGIFDFDVRHTSSCVGKVSEVFRTWPSAIRSVHPTHSVAACGPRAEQLVSGHESATTPCGKGTPYEKLINQDGQILFLGTTLDQNTVFHTLESLAEVPYLMRATAEEFRITLSNGVTEVMQFKRHGHGPDRCFSGHEALLERVGALRAGKVGTSRSLLVDSALMARTILERLQGDEGFLVAS